MKKTSFSQYDLLTITTKDKQLQGLFIKELDNKDIMLKISSGYNIIVKKQDISSIKVLESPKNQDKKSTVTVKEQKDLPRILVLHTGGTFASKVDYRTGAVSANFSPSELLTMFPELKSIANIDSKLCMQMFSEDITPAHWKLIAKDVAEAIRKKYSGVIITHGTDTMSYTSAALSFMLKNLPIPVIFTGSQRSSDRASSDAALNIICAAQFIVKSNFKGVAICMHSNTEDSSCLVHLGTKAKKLHTSRRDSFRSINAMPVAKVTPDGNIEYLSKIVNKEGDFKILPEFEDKIAIIKVYPGFNPNILDSYSNYKGLILEGTGLGHFPINNIDEHTKTHKLILSKLKALAAKMPVIMTSASFYGRVDMNVYSTGRDLQEAGIISGSDMLTETAFVKLGWLLANVDKNKVKEEILVNYANEINNNLPESAFLN